MCVGAPKSSISDRTERERHSPWLVWFCVPAAGVFILGWLLVNADIVGQNRNAHMAQKYVDEYNLVVSRLGKGTVDSIRKRIRRYDEGLSPKSPGAPFLPTRLDESQSYADLLQEVIPSVMRCLVIPRVGLSQPIYYGPPDKVLEKVSGILRQRSFHPIWLVSIPSCLFNPARVRDGFSIVWIVCPRELGSRSEFWIVPKSIRSVVLTWLLRTGWMLWKLYTERTGWC